MGRLRGVRARRVSIHAPRMRGDGGVPEPVPGGVVVSIHAPRMRGDGSRACRLSLQPCFNPRPSHEGRPYHPGVNSDVTSGFNPRPSHEGRRSGVVAFRPLAPRFNPRPSHEGRPGCTRSSSIGARVSIHAPRMRGDAKARHLRVRNPVSIHAPRMRGDSSFLWSS